MSDDKPIEVDDEPGDELVDDLDASRISEAVVFSSDWTAQTIVEQLRKGNISLSPRFQRRDAWNRARKSRLVESLVIGLPVPQIVLAEAKEQRGKYLILDGKQRLLSLLQFWGLGEGTNVGFPLSGLDVRDDLRGKRYEDLADPIHADDLAALQNQTVRTVVIRNWPSNAFLHLVFLRLNTGSVGLSPQELRQALKPGPFTDYVDDAAVESEGLKSLLRLSAPDPRMRDVEILARHLSFSFFLNDYRGRMKSFLDHCFEVFNDSWATYQSPLAERVEGFDRAVLALIDALGAENVARKPGSRSFNRAVFDALALYTSHAPVCDWVRGNPGSMKSLYNSLFLENEDFRVAIESDTAGVPNTVKRLAEFGTALRSASGLDVPIPRRTGDNRIEFFGFE